MSVSRIVTAMSFATLGLVFAAVSAWSLTVSANHLILGSFRQSAVTASVGLAVLMPLVCLLQPARRAPILAWLGGGLLGRTASVLLALGALSVCGAVLAFSLWARPDLSAGAQGVAVLLVALVVAMLVVTTFIYPGFAYAPYRPVSGEDDWYYEPEGWSFSETLSFLDREDEIEPGRLHILMAELGAIGAFGITALGWYGWRYASFLPSAEAQAWVVSRGPWLGLAVFVLLAATVALYPAATGRWFPGHRVGFKLFLMGMMAVPAALSPMAVSRGLPSLTAGLAGRDVGAAEVVMVSPSTSPRTCDRAAWAVPTGRPGAEVRICNIPAALWTELKPGDYLLLTGWQTGWGLDYLSYTAKD